HRFRGSLTRTWSRGLCNRARTISPSSRRDSVPNHSSVDGRIESRQLAPGGSMRSFTAIINTAVVCLVAVPIAAQQPPAPVFEKKEFTHSAWTKGIFSEAVTVKGFGRGT